MFTLWYLPLDIWWFGSLINVSFLTSFEFILSVTECRVEDFVSILVRQSIQASELKATRLYSRALYMNSLCAREHSIGQRMNLSQHFNPLGQFNL